MKRILAIFLMFGLWCFYLNTAQAVTINEGATVTAIPASGTVHNGTRVLVFLKSTQNPLSINDLSIRGYENAKKCSLIDPYYVKKTPCFQYKIK